jgi:hypothetical protein
VAATRATGDEAEAAALAQALTATLARSDAATQH